MAHPGCAALTENGEQHPSKPRGFNVLTRIVFVHQAFALAVLGSDLNSELTRGSELSLWLTAAGLAIAVATVMAMVVVARRRSLLALTWLRVLLWAAVVRGGLGLLTLAGVGGAQLADSLRSLVLNEAVLIPLAIYWSRAAHSRYLADLRHA